MRIRRVSARQPLRPFRPRRLGTFSVPHFALGVEGLEDSREAIIVRLQEAKGDVTLRLKRSSVNPQSTAAPLKLGATAYLTVCTNEVQPAAGPEMAGELDVL